MEKSISIISVNFNNLAGLENTIKSVISQSFTNYEYIVIDGGSTDGSINLISQYSDSIDLWISEKDNGIYDAMNKGIAKATGQYIMFLNSGDLLADNTVLERCINKLKEFDKTDILYGDLVVNNHKDSKYKEHLHPQELSLAFLEKDTINHQASFIKKDIFNEFGYYPLEYKLASDFWLFLKCFLYNKSFLHYKSKLIVYDFSGASAKDDFKHYRQEQDKIWNILVPQYIKIIMQENRRLITDTYNLNSIVEARIVKASIKINNKLKNIRNFLLSFIK